MRMLANKKKKEKKATAWASRTLHQGASKLISGGAGYFGVTPCSLSCLQCALSLPLCYLMRPAGGKYIFSFWRKLSLPGLLADVSPLLCHFHPACVSIFLFRLSARFHKQRLMDARSLACWSTRLLVPFFFFIVSTPHSPSPPTPHFRFAQFSVLHY